MEDLAAVYNQTRIDYLVPMPMSAARLGEYIHVYDVDLSASCVLLDNAGLFGLGMLGVRPGRGWITRLGVVPERRQAGAGRAMMEFLLEAAAARGLETIWLEVIKGNVPAYNLFQRHDFHETRELLVVRRSPIFRGSPAAVAQSIRAIDPLSRVEALSLLAQRQERPNWLNETESMRNARQLEALMVQCHDGGYGWASFDVGKFQLSRIVVDVIQGDPVTVTAAILQAIHQHYPRKDTVIENIAADDPKWPGFQQIGYFDSFRRIEMVREEGRRQKAADKRSVPLEKLNFLSD
ncbi:MAG: hypothetical protein Fur0021_10600 [Candidatus Promineifilaceae bacterium]